MGWLPAEHPLNQELRWLQERVSRGMDALDAVLCAEGVLARTAQRGSQRRLRSRRLTPGELVAGSTIPERFGESVALGFGLLAIGLLAGATTAVGSNYAFAAAWMTVLGLGLGFALPATMDVALGALSPERSGVGTALLLALRQVGGTIGVAVLGAVLASGYAGALGGGVPEAARESVSAGATVANQIGSPSLLDSVQRAFVGGMDTMLRARSSATSPPRRTWSFMTSSIRS